MSDRIPRDEEHRLRDGLERLAGRAPRTFDAPPGMLRRARRRLAAVVTAVVVVAASVVVGGVALGRVLSDRNSRPAPATTTGPTTPPPSGPSPSFQASSSPSAGPVPVTCSFGPQPIPQLPGDLAKVVHRDGSFQLAGADGPSPDDVWVVGTVHGAFGKPAVTTGVVLHWDGSSMRVLPPFRGTGFGSVDAPAADDAWASTGVGPLHWNGASWSSDGRPVVAGGTNDLAVSAAAPDDVWAVGTRPPSHGTDSTLFAERFDGTRWTEAAVPKDVAGPVMALDSVAAIAPDDAWAVGGDEAATDPGPPVVLRWDGAGWRAVEVPFSGSDPLVGRAVSASSADDVWVTADAVGEHFQTAPGLVLRWDGSAWHDATPPAPAGRVLHLQTLDAVAPNDVWAGGSAFDSGTGESVPVVEHFDGSVWTIVRLGSGAPAGGLIRSIRAIGGEVWAVGFGSLHEPPFLSVCR